MRRIWLLFALLAAVLVGSVTAAVHGAQAAPSYLQRDSVLVQSALGRAVDLQLTRVTSAAPDPRSPVVGSPIVTFSDYIDRLTGNGVMVDSRGVIKEISSPTAYQSIHLRSALLSNSQLRSIAQSYLASKFPGSSSRVATESLRAVFRGTDGQVDRQYSVEFSDLIDGVPSCNYAVVTLAPTNGDMISVVRDDGPVPSGLHPSITAGDAMTRAAALDSMPVRSSQSAELVYFRKPQTGEPHLTWHVVLETGTPAFGMHTESYIDAVDGSFVWGWESK